MAGRFFKTGCACIFNPFVLSDKLSVIGIQANKGTDVEGL